MEQEVETLLRKENIEVVPPHDTECRFYSRYFIVPKKDGGLPPILDLRRLNHSVMRLKFRMLTIASHVPNQVRGLVFDDRSERHLLPHIHSSSTLEVLEVRFQGQNIPISSSSVRPCTLTPHFHEVCGCSPGSVATPGHPHTQLHRRLVFQKLLGLMAAASNVVTFGLLYRPLQWCLRTTKFSPSGNPFHKIKVTQQCFPALDMWKKPWFLSQGPVLGAPYRRVMLTTDASLTGWGRS